MDIDEVVKRIVERRAEVPEKLSLLAGISGIDGCGKGYIAAQIEARLAQHAVTSAVINVDGWLNLPDKRFDSDAPAERFYESAIRFDEFFSDLVMPLRDQRSVHLVADFVEETARQYRKHVYNINNVDVILVEGIFLFKQAYRSLFDVAIWVDCTFATALARALQRAQEGLPPAETIAAYETIYFPAQRIHFDKDNPRGSADLILDNNFCSARRFSNFGSRQVNTRSHVAPFARQIR
jgi:uridine kinase